MGTEKLPLPAPTSPMREGSIPQHRGFHAQEIPLQSKSQRAPKPGASKPEHTAKDTCHSPKIYQHSRFISCLSLISRVTFMVWKVFLCVKGKHKLFCKHRFKNLKILLIWCLNCYWEEETGVPLFLEWPQASKKWPTVLEFASQIAGSSVALQCNQFPDRRRGRERA